MGEVVLLRHGETDWSAQRRHTGRTDLPLNAIGEDQARHARRLVGEHRFALVLVSPLQRARHTAQLAGLETVRTDDRLLEWDYGGFEGLTTQEIRQTHGAQWSIWEATVPAGQTPGEQLADVGARARSLIDDLGPTLAEGDVALVAHAHLLRVLTACFLGLPPVGGAGLSLAAGSVSVLGDEHGSPVVRRWNLDPTVTERLT